MFHLSRSLRPLTPISPFTRAQEEKRLPLQRASLKVPGSVGKLNHFHKPIRTHSTGVEMLLKERGLAFTSVHLSWGREGGREEGKETVIFVTAIVLSNKETSSLARRGRRYHASAA